MVGERKQLSCFFSPLDAFAENGARSRAAQDRDGDVPRRKGIREEESNLHTPSANMITILFFVLSFGVFRRRPSIFFFHSLEGPRGSRSVVSSFNRPRQGLPPRVFSPSKLSLSLSKERLRARLLSFDRRTERKGTLCSLEKEKRA